MQKTNLQRGFTLIELLVVIGILAVLLSITLIAINPQRQFAQANNTKRESDINAILNGIHQYGADNAGSLPTGLDSVTCPVATPCTISNNTAVTPRVDICSSLVTRYLAALPADPTQANGAPISNCAATYNTGYTVSVSASDQRITVTAPLTTVPPAAAIFSVTR
jgi:type IV pilus assembly protein PilA